VKTDISAKGEKGMCHVKITNHKCLLFAALLAATLVVGTEPVQADMVSYTGGLKGQSTDTYPDSLLPPLLKDGSISLNQFNTAMGTLNSITIDLSSVFDYVTKFENNSPNSGSTVTKNLDQWLMIGTPWQIMLDTTPVIYSKQWNVSKYDGTTDYAGRSGFTVSDTSDVTNKHLTLSGAALTPYIGTGSLLFAVYSNAIFSGGFTGGNGVFNNSQDFVTSATVTYNYTPTSIPAAGWLLGSGLLGMAGIRRKIIINNTGGTGSLGSLL